MAGVKAVMNMTGKKGGYPRKPVLPVKEEMLAEIREYMEAHEELIAEDL